MVHCLVLKKRTASRLSLLKWWTRCGAQANPNGVDTETVRVLTCQLARAIEYCHRHDAGEPWKLLQKLSWALVGWLGQVSLSFNSLKSSKVLGARYAEDGKSFRLWIWCQLLHVDGCKAQPLELCWALALGLVRFVIESSVYCLATIDISWYFQGNNFPPFGGFGEGIAQEKHGNWRSVVLSCWLFPFMFQTGHPSWHQTGKLAEPGSLRRDWEGIEMGLPGQSFEDGHRLTCFFWLEDMAPLAQKPISGSFLGIRKPSFFSLFSRLLGCSVLT